MSLTVSEVKALMPEADVYALKPETTLLIAVKRGSATQHDLAGLAEALGKGGLENVMVVAVDNPATDLRIFEV